MSEFKLGDRVVLVKNPTPDQNIGDCGVIVLDADGAGDYKVLYDSGREFFEMKEFITHETIKCIIKTETKIQGGLYGIVEIFSHDGNLVNIEIKYNSCDAKELLEASQVLKEIAEILQNNP